MHNPAETYKTFVAPEIEQVCLLLSPDFNSHAIPSFLANNHPEMVYSVLLRHKLFPVFYKKWVDLCSAHTLTPEWTLFTAQLKQKAETNRLQMLQKTAALLSIANAFEAAQIPILPLKGPVLAHLLYGDISMKASLDLDILVPKAQFPDAWKTLMSLGFRTEFNYELSPKQKKYLLSHFHHLAFINGNIRVELHWEINTNRYMTGRPNEEFFQKAVPINIAGKTIQTLHTEHLTEYLAIHGSYHAWSRLDWLYDFSQVLATTPETQHRISENMHRAGLGIIFDQSATLSHLLFPGSMPHTTQKIPISFIRIPLKEMSKSYLEAKHRGLSRFAQKMFLLKLKNSWKYRMHIFSVLGTNQGNWKMLKLPDKLFFLYYILRPFLYLAQIKKEKNFINELP